MGLNTNKVILKRPFAIAVVIRPVILLAATLLAFSDRCCSLAAPANDSYKIIKSLEGLGSAPSALIEGKDGRLYGALEAGGAKGNGAVFALNKDGTGYTVLHAFKGASVEGDGSGTQGLVEGSDGVLYGTTKMGGTAGGVLEAMGLSEMGNGTAP